MDLDWARSVVALTSRPRLLPSTTHMNTEVPHPACRPVAVRQRPKADGREGRLVVDNQLLQRIVALRRIRQVLPVDVLFGRLTSSW